MQVGSGSGDSVQGPDKSCRAGGRSGMQWDDLELDQCHALNTFGTVNTEHTIDSSLSWSER